MEVIICIKVLYLSDNDRADGGRRKKCFWVVSYLIPSGQAGW